MGMTKAEYEMEKAKEDRQDNRFHFSTKNYFIILGIGLVIAIILSTVNPQPKPCEKYGNDWKYNSGGRGVRSACINSNAYLIKINNYEYTRRNTRFNSKNMFNHIYSRDIILNN